MAESSSHIYSRNLWPGARFRWGSPEPLCHIVGRGHPVKTGVRLQQPTSVRRRPCRLGRMHDGSVHRPSPTAPPFGCGYRVDRGVCDADRQREGGHRLSDQAGTRVRALWGRRGRRPDHAALGRQAWPGTQTAIRHRKSSGRGRHRVGDRSAARGARRLHARRDRQRTVDQRFAVQETSVRRAEGFYHGLGGRQLRDAARGTGQFAL